MQKYSFGPKVRFGVLIQLVCGVLGLFVSTGAAVLMFWAMRRIETPSSPNLLQNPQATFTCVGAWSLLIGWTVSISLINASPTIWVGEDGITISAFLIFKILIPWSDIVDINSIRFGHYLVRARRITFFHRIYGWLYSRSLYPGFILRKDITDRDRLVSEISRHIQ